MRWCGSFLSFLFFSCGSQADETFVPVRDSLGQSSPTTTADTSPAVVSDTASHASFTTPPIKKPSGIYEFVLPYGEGRILHTVAFYPGTFRLQEEYLDRPDSVVVTEGTWAPSQGYIWLYNDHLARGRYTWTGDTLQYYSPQLKRKFSLAKLTPASQNRAWQQKKADGALLYGIGTEPFWSVEINKDDSIVLNMPDWPQPLRAKATVATENESTVYTAETDSLQVTVYPFFCSDGMSDFTYTNKVVVRYKGQVYRGCGARL